MAIELQGQYQALARKYRPQTFEDVVGQEHVINALKNSIEQQRIHHAYLLTGTRGIGKTTIARIIAKCLECETGITAHPHINGEPVCDTCKAIADGNFPDVIEIDGASQTKVDDTRQLLESTQYPPLKGRFKVYIIDEVHMLSQSSFNALLKTLEEPPAYVKFILATTDPQKIPVTVLSRCLQFQLKALTVNQISAQIAKIATKENISFENEAVNLLARAARGSMRDALSLCDQAVALGNGSITKDNVQAMLGTAGDGFVCSVLDLLKNPSVPVNAQASAQVPVPVAQSQKTLSDVLNEIRTISPNYRTLLNDLVLCFHDLALFQMIGYPQNINIFSIPQSTLTTYAPLFSSEALQLYYQIALQGIEEYKVSSDGSTAFEMTILRMLAFTPEKKKDWIGEDNSVEVIYLNPVVNSAVLSSLTSNALDKGHAPESNSSLASALKNEAQSYVADPATKVTVLTDHNVIAHENTVLQNGTAVNQELVRQDLVNKVASENFTLKPEITNALVAEAQSITNSSTLNIVNNEHTVDPGVLTDNAKSQALNEALPVDIVKATTTNITATDDVASASPVTETSDSASKRPVVAPKSGSDSADTLPQVNTQINEVSVVAKNTVVTSAKADNAAVNLTDHNTPDTTETTANTSASNDVPKVTPSEETNAVAATVAPTEATVNEINEFPVPDINPQSQVFTVNSANQAPAFGSTHNSKTDDLNVLIQGLETLNNQVVTNNNPHLGEYRKVLTNIITPKTTESSIVPENEELHVNSTLSQLSDVRQNHDLQEKFKLISDVSQYINHVYAVLKGYQTEAESLKEGKSKSSHIEGMSSIISDMTYGKNDVQAANDENPSTDAISTDAISKLPTFNENGEIVTASNPAEPNSNEPKLETQVSSESLKLPNSGTVQDNHVQDNGVQGNAVVAPVNTATVVSEPNNAENISTASNNTVPETTVTDKKAVENTENLALNTAKANNSTLVNQDNHTLVDDFTKAVQEIASDKENESKDVVKTLSSDEILTPQVAELTPDELLRKAQEEALAQLQSNQTLNQKLKEEAATLNQNVDVSSLTEDSNKAFLEDDKANLNSEIPDAVNTATVNSVSFDNSAALVDASNNDIPAITASTEVSANVPHEIAVEPNQEVTAPLNTTNTAIETNQNASAENVANDKNVKNAENSENVDKSDESSNIPLATLTSNNNASNTPNSTGDLSTDTTVSSVQDFIPLSKAVALELQKGSYTDTVPVIKARTYSKSLELAINETLNGQLGNNHNVTDNGNAVSNTLATNKIASNSNLSQQVATVKTQSAPVTSVTQTAHAQSSDGTNAPVAPEKIPSSEVPPDFYDEVPVDAYEFDADPVGNAIVDESYDDDEYSQGARVTGSDLKFDNIATDENSSNTDGNPKKFRESTLKLIEEDQQFENKRLGRQLQSSDFYDRVYKNDLWYQDIVKAGYNDGPVYSALCYTNRLISPDNPYAWVLQISADFQLLFISPEFHHNLRTKFSIEQGHPVELKIEKVQGIPSGCPEDLARKFYVKEIEDTRNNMAKDKNISLLLENLGEDIRTLNLSLYKQEDDKAVVKK